MKREVEREENRAVGIEKRKIEEEGRRCEFQHFESFMTQQVRWVTRAGTER